MPALIGLSPRLADQSFPRDDHELRTVSVALGKISELVENRSVEILRTEFFLLLLDGFHWDERGGIKNQIYTHLRLWFLNGRSVAAPTEPAPAHFSLHPLPEGCRTQGRLEETWAEEMGKLLAIHDQHSLNAEYFIGIACEKAFGGQSIGTYEPHQCCRYFPLVGPGGCDCRQNDCPLADAYHLEAPPAYTQTEVSFEAAKKNVFALGAVEVRAPRRGSHYKVKFRNARSWTLDPNNDPVPRDFLRELEPITGHPLEVIAYALREGKLPPRKLRFAP